MTYKYQTIASPVEINRTAHAAGTKTKSPTSCNVLYQNHLHVARIKVLTLDQAAVDNYYAGKVLCLSRSYLLICNLCLLNHNSPLILCLRYSYSSSSKSGFKLTCWCYPKDLLTPFFCRLVATMAFFAEPQKPPKIMQSKDANCTSDSYEFTTSLSAKTIPVSTVHSISSMEIDERIYIIEI